jgi:hypothetical protein
MEDLSRRAEDVPDFLRIQRILRKNFSAIQKKKRMKVARI